MSLGLRLANTGLRGVTGLICRVDIAALARLPQHGPLIVVLNHINWLDVPLLMARAAPRRVVGLAKVESWESPLLGALLDLWGTIPLRRGEADMGALRRALAVLRTGDIVAVFPEGTRSGHGRLQEGQPGAVLLALHSGAPILPVVHYGGERLSANLKRLRRTDLHITVGRPFYLDPHGMPVTREVRREMTTEMMFQMAALLPPAYRGRYGDLSAASERYLRFPDGSAGNLDPSV